MKKVFSFVAVSLALVLSAFFISCKAPSGGSGGGAGSGGGSSGGGETPTDYKAGDIALERIKIGDTEYDYTAEVYVTGTDGATIVGKTNTNNDKGVFINGRTVTLSPFIMSKYEVTQELYTAVMTNQTVSVGGQTKTLASAPFYCKADSNDLKVLLTGEEQKYRAAEGMTWYDAVFFCNALSEKTGLTNAYTITNITVNSNGKIIDATVALVSGANGYRLPTEAEWEFAARGGDPTAAAWDYTFSGAAKADGSSYSADQNTGLDTVGWYWYNTGSGTTSDSAPSSGTAGYGTHHVGKKAYNKLGIYDMSGNVVEWCWDWYNGSVTSNDAEYITDGVVINPTGGSGGSRRVYRGGDWCSSAGYCSVCRRDNFSPGGTGDNLGFRVCRNAN